MNRLIRHQTCRLRREKASHRFGQLWFCSKIRDVDYQVVEVTFECALVQVCFRAGRFVAGRTVLMTRQQIVKKRLRHGADAENQQQYQSDEVLYRFVFSQKNGFVKIRLKTFFCVSAAKWHSDLAQKSRECLSAIMKTLPAAIYFMVAKIHAS